MRELFEAHPTLKILIIVLGILLATMLLAKLLKALLTKLIKKLTAKKEDPTLMTKEEFLARVDEAEKGASRRFDNVADLDRYIRSL